MVVKLLRTIYVVYALVFLFLSVLFLLLISIPFIVIIKKNRFKPFFYIFHHWFRVLLLFIGIVVKNKYEDSCGAAIHENKSVFIANHLSYLDALVIIASIKNVCRPLGKEGIATIPLIGFLYKQLVIMVNRKSNKSKIESLKEMRQTLQHGYSVMLFPEGTFHNNVYETLNPFRDGAFHLAIDNKVSIKPILILYARERLHPKSIFTLNPGIIIAYYLKSISTEKYSLSNADELKNYTFNVMKKKLDELGYPQKEPKK